MITVVAGPCGAGKTTWILQELAQMPTSSVYVTPGIGTVPIDVTRVTAKFPQIEVFHYQPETELLQRLAAGIPIYVELGFQLETNIPLLEARPHRRIALVAEENRDAGWQLWADEVIRGNPSTLDLQSAQLWRAPLSGQVFDPPSLDTFWQELTQGAYGEVHRAKGIFELADGQAFHLDFVNSLPGSAYTELNLPQWVEGRPNRFSGIEVVGQRLDEGAIVATLKDCYLSDSLLAAHQATLRDSFSLEAS
ncbi:GTP-binding protein [Oscillatoria sp. CS-180]|uniref:GTP-binding protein n=1 Tax=Oscillatoria sp. CS-180 TaxID=3021720 RepID=UPI002330B094|nr:GTP-binding protein [Oscillatoria sp. CS-180]MDB9526303.1 GTP-binding protein [Oscillatoria sp. CS-180]